MRQLKMQVLVIFSMSACFPTLLYGQQTPKSTYDDFANPIRYLEYLPPGYSTKGATFPLLIFLHGGGEAGDGTLESLERVKSWGPPKLIEGGHDMCFVVDGEKKCFIVISPQLQLNDNSWTFTVSQVVDHILNGPDNYKVDPDRIYLTGLSRGGMGVYQYASSFNNYPNKLAAIAPIAAWIEGNYNPCQISRRRIPVWAFHGRLDTVVPQAQGRSAFNRIESCANAAPEVEMIFTSYADRYHDSWIPAYNTEHTYHTPNLYEWLLKQERPDVIVTGISDSQFEKETDFSVYPNPATDVISLSFLNSHFRPSILRILSMTGESVRAEINQAGQIDISQLTAGVYAVQMANDAGIVGVARFVKLR